MKILVNNKREKELFEKFTYFLSGYLDSKEMRDLMKGADYLFEDHEIDFLQTGFSYNIATIDKKVCNITIPTDNLSGICRYCNREWNGIEDIHEANIYDYEHFLNLEKGGSYHAECYRENQCENCGSDEETEKTSNGDALCKDCQKKREWGINLKKTFLVEVEYKELKEEVLYDTSLEVAVEHFLHAYVDTNSIAKDFKVNVKEI